VSLNNYDLKISNSYRNKNVLNLLKWKKLANVFFKITKFYWHNINVPYHSEICTANLIALLQKQGPLRYFQYFQRFKFLKRLYRNLFLLQKCKNSGAKTWRAYSTNIDLSNEILQSCDILCHTEILGSKLLKNFNFAYALDKKKYPMQI
jgi:hypothetical protein